MGATPGRRRTWRHNPKTKSSGFNDGCAPIRNDTISATCGPKFAVSAVQRKQHWWSSEQASRQHERSFDRGQVSIGTQITIQSVCLSPLQPREVRFINVVVRGRVLQCISSTLVPTSPLSFCRTIGTLCCIKAWLTSRQFAL